MHGMLRTAQFSRRYNHLQCGIYVVCYMNLNTERLRVRLQCKCLERPLERELVSYHLVEVQDAPLHALDCGGPRIPVAVDKLEVNLEGARISIHIHGGCLS